MYEYDENYLVCRASKSRYEEITGSMVLVDGTVIPITLNRFLENNINISSANTKGSDIAFGIVHANMLSIAIYTDLSRYALYGADITLTYTVYDKKPEEGIEYLSSEVALGKFTVAEVEKNAGVASITAYDYMKKLDTSFGTAVFSGTAHDILQTVSARTGVPFTYSVADMSQFFNSTEVLQFDSTSGLKTHRDIVSAVCQLLGVCCRANRVTGGIELYKFDTVPVATVQMTDWRLSEAWIADYTVRFNGFSVTSVKGTFKKVRADIPGITMIIEDAPAWDYGLPESLRDRAIILSDFIQQVQYTPCDVSIFSNPIYDCGDMVRIEVDGVYVNTLLTEINWTFQAPTQIKSIGTNVLLEKVKVAESDRQISRGGASNKLVSYDVTNDSDLVLNSGDEETLCDIAFNTAQETHCMWLANVLVETQADTGYDHTDLKVTYTYDGNEIIFYPQEHYSDGNHTFSLFYPISSVTEQSVHRWKVDITALNGTVTILEENFKGTLFGQNLVEQEYWDGILVLDDMVSAYDTVLSPLVVTESGIHCQIYDPNDEVHKLWVIDELADTISAYPTDITLITKTEECIITLKWAFGTQFCRATTDGAMGYIGEELLL